MFLQFNEFISRLEGSERTVIPTALILAVKEFCKLYNYNPLMQPEKITYRFVREALKTKGYAEYFENISQIRGILTGRPPRRFTEEQKKNLERIFKEIQAPFEKHRGKRTNFLSYAYTTYKSCELLNYTEFLPMLPLLKAKKNLDAADELWKKICDELQYEFVPTFKDN